MSCPRPPALSPAACLHAISARLTEASALVAAALACAQAGSERQALRLVLDLDIPLREAATLHGALCLLGRLQANTAATEGQRLGDAGGQPPRHAARMIAVRE